MIDSRADTRFPELAEGLPFDELRVVGVWYH